MEIKVLKEREREDVGFQTPLRGRHVRIAALPLLCLCQHPIYLVQSVVRLVLPLLQLGVKICETEVGSNSGFAAQIAVGPKP